MNLELLENGTNMPWVDFLANGNRLSALEEREKLVRLTKEAGVTHLVVDAKIPYGHTTYPSRFALNVSECSNGRFQNWENADFLREMIRDARRIGLKVFANVNVFAEGTKASGDGIAFSKKGWQVVYLPTESQLSVYAEDADDDTLFVNPIHPEVIDYELSIFKEIVSDYDIDGIVLDRCRYPNVHADFSELSRAKFEEYINENFIMTGCYCPEVYIKEAMANRRPAHWYSVEGAIAMSLEAINSRIPVVASLFLKDYEGNLDQFHRAVRLCRERMHGVILFDAVYLEKYGWWQDIAPVLETRL